MEGRLCIAGGGWVGVLWHTGNEQRIFLRAGSCMLDWESLKEQHEPQPEVKNITRRSGHNGSEMVFFVCQKQEENTERNRVTEGTRSKMESF